VKPRALDLFCGAGGASRGLQLAGFHVTGVDIKPQPRYAGEVFIQANAMTFPLDGFDFIWASPPCQRYSAGAAKWGTSEDHPDLIAPVRNLLLAAGVPYVIENIAPAAPLLRDPIMLCGTMFGLGVFRHRMFESNTLLLAPEHMRHVGRIGDGKYHTVTGHAGGSSKRDGWKGGGVADWRVAMGIDWMVGDELAEAIPPAFSRFVGEQVMQSIAAARKVGAA
jgi:DNA (cytosine-5)-methyltransferase 1